VLHRLYFSPGMFGFGRLASYDYFVHLERALVDELRARGDEVATWVVDVPPTASVARRAARFAELVARTSEDDDGPIHLVGHSTGGIDARLVASPGVRLPCDGGALAWIGRLASVTTLSTPHYGTPLASIFATVSGQRLLYALSALTFIALSLGSPPLAAASALVVAISRLDRALGVDIKIIDRTTEALLRVLDDARSREVRAYLDAIQSDQGAVVQLMPEAMELVQAGIEDREGVAYQSTASMAPPPLEAANLWRRARAAKLRDLINPWIPLSTAIFTMLYGLTSRYDERYPCAARTAGPETEATLARAFGQPPGPRANDGVVPIRSQLWGRVVWCGYADHLDVLGHFNGGAGRGREEPEHVDWLASGSGFDRARFDAMTRAIANGMHAAARARVARPVAAAG
jgi:triacylglycerol esterase/lipase EstA (alpha/beta hydrolase family)